MAKTAQAKSKDNKIAKFIGRAIVGLGLLGGLIYLFTDLLPRLF